MRRVVIESPYAGKSENPGVYAGEVAYNLRYLRACMADCLARGEAPFASHGLYTQPGVLDDTIPEERAKGIAAGFVWGEGAEARAFYCDLGWSGGMRDGQREAARLDQPCVHRFLCGEWSK